MRDPCPRHRRSSSHFSRRRDTRRGGGRGHAATAARAAATPISVRRAVARSPAVVPPQTPSWPVAVAHSRHTTRTGHPVHTSRACNTPSSDTGKNTSGSTPAQCRPGCDDNSGGTGNPGPGSSSKTGLRSTTWVASSESGRLARCRRGDHPGGTRFGKLSTAQHSNRIVIA
ncbi:hypothetical protein Ae331Ps2_6384c [Pseudonocardia sp. Ae331_Ps2]|nr:hypothetical protein Ae331Ps2_6384c [Pseudonocardia sp. Ae331_Ps2]